MFFILLFRRQISDTDSMTALFNFNLIYLLGIKHFLLRKHWKSKLTVDSSNWFKFIRRNPKWTDVRIVWADCSSFSIDQTDHFRHIFHFWFVITITYIIIIIIIIRFSFSRSKWHLNLVSCFFCHLKVHFVRTHVKQPELWIFWFSFRSATFLATSIVHEMEYMMPMFYWCQSRPITLVKETRSKFKTSSADFHNQKKKTKKKHKTVLKAKKRHQSSIHIIIAKNS